MGCSSVDKNSEKTLTVTTNVQEAEVFLDGKPYGYIYGGILTVELPDNSPHTIMLKTDTDSHNEVIDKSFNEEYLYIYLPKKKALNKENYVGEDDINLKKELDNLKLKEDIKHELELERTKERVLKLETQNN